MIDGLLRLKSKNLFKMFTDSDFTSGNSFTLEENFQIVPTGTRCVLHSVNANVVYAGVPSSSSNINNNNDSYISFRNTNSTGDLKIKIKPAFSVEGIFNRTLNDQPLLFNVPCGGVLFDDGMHVNFTAKTGSESAAAAPAADYGFNVNILYSGGS